MKLTYKHLHYNDLIEEVEDLLPLVQNEQLQTFFGELLDQQITHHDHNQIGDVELQSRLLSIIFSLKELDLTDPNEID